MGVRQRLGSSFVSLGATFHNPGLRRLLLAWVGSILGNWAYGVGLAVYAYAQGGAAAVGLVGVIRLIPAAILAPFAASLADRFSRKAVMVGSDAIRAVLMVLAGAVIATDGPAPVVYALVGVSTVTSTVFRPAQNALLPSLARSPAELSAANVASSTLESVGTFLGPAVGGLLLAVTNVEVVFFVNALTFVWSGLLVLAVRTGAEGDAPARSRKKGMFGPEAVAGFRTIWGDRRLRLLTLAYGVQALTAGVLIVLTVVVAIDLLDLGSSGVGLLNAMIGVGGVIGGLLALVLAARGRLGSDLALGIVLFAAPLAILGGVPEVAVAVAALVLVGAGNSITDVSAVTLYQRVAPDEVLARVLGVTHSILLGSIGLGQLLAPLLVELLDVRVALIVAGCVPVAVTAIVLPALRRLDGATAPASTELLRGVPFFAVLDEATLERLARSAREVRVRAGTPVVRAGEAGDRFYVVQAGEVEVTADEPVVEPVLGPGASFGEIALLRDVPRTATVTARTDVVLQAIERDDFLGAVVGDEEALSVADSVVGYRLGDAIA